MTIVRRKKQSTSGEPLHIVSVCLDTTICRFYDTLGAGGVKMAYPGQFVTNSSKKSPQLGPLYLRSSDKGGSGGFGYD